MARIDYYSYKDLRRAAESGKQEDINALGEWFRLYGESYWNGEYYDADNDERLFPIYNYDGEFAEIVGYEFK